MNNIHSTIHEMHFNSRPSARGDLPVEEQPPGNHISIHAPPRGATGFHSLVDTLVGISIHAPPRGATGFALLLSGFYTISIHAPPRGATRVAVFQRAARIISIHAPPRGATTLHHHCATFNHISIHAPPRGATIRRSKPPIPALYFNSRPSARGDAQPVSDVNADIFQFTPLREGRPVYRRSAIRDLYFNSRPSARGDGKRYAISANLLFNPYKSAWLNNSATQFVEIILVIFHRIIA